jgi:hypothetical protein
VTDKDIAFIALPAGDGDQIERRLSLRFMQQKFAMAVFGKITLAEPSTRSQLVYKLQYSFSDR